jgi:long-subunit fatty acid transport protein
MIKIKVMLILFVWMLTHIVYGADKKLTIFPHGMGISSFQSVGFSNMNECTVSEVAGANPASMANFNVPGAGISFKYTTAAESRFSDLTIRDKRSKQWLPASFAIIYPNNDFRVGIGFHEKYNVMSEIGEIEVTNIEEPEGTGETISITEKTSVYSISGIFSYTFGRLFTDNDIFTAGAQLCWDFTDGGVEGTGNDAALTGNGISFKIAALYNLNQQTSVSLLYEKGVDLNSTWEYDTAIRFQSEIPYTDPTALPAEFDNSFRIKLPDRLAIGYLTRTSENLSVSTTLSSVLWSSIDKQYQNALDVSFSAQYKGSENVSYMLGYYSTGRYKKKSSFTYDNIPDNAAFLSAGFLLKYNHVTINIVAYDSHLFAAENRKQTIFKAGLDYYFDEK